MKRFGLFVMMLLVVGLVFTGCASKKSKGTTGSLQRIYFDFDKSNIKPEYQDELKSNAKWLQDHPNTKVVIEGHCDKRGSIEYNIALGDRRANSAKSYLETLGVASSRMSTVSYGKERPLVPNCNDESCYWQNRRDEFVAK